MLIKYIQLIYSFITTPHPAYCPMAPKTTFSIPMGAAVNVETQTRKSKRTSRSMQAVVPLPPSSKQAKPGRSSGSGPKADTNAEQVPTKASGRPSHGIEVSQPLDFFEEREDDIQDFDKYEGHAQSNVCNPVNHFFQLL